MKERRHLLPFTPANYRLMLIGIGIIALGFVIMSLETAEFGFGILGLTVGPIVVMAGFGFQFYAILHEGGRPTQKLDIQLDAEKARPQRKEPAKVMAEQPAPNPSPAKPKKKSGKRKK